MDKNSNELQELPNNVCVSELEILQTIYDSIPDGVTISDTKTGQILHANRVYTEITGYSKTKLDKNNIQGPFDKKEWSQIAKKRDAAAIEEIIILVDIPITTRDKKSKWVDLKSRKATCDNRLVNIDFYTDVTKRVSTKEEARTIIHELNKAQEIGNIGSWGWNVLTGEEKLSDHFYAIWGLPIQPATYELFINGIHPEDISIVNESIDKAFKKEKDYDVIFRVVHKNGDIRVVNSIGEVEFNEADQPVYMRGTVKDITEAYYSDQENKKLKSLFDNSNDFIAFASLEGKVEFVNKSGRAMVGLDPSEDLSTKTITDFLTEEGLETSQNHEIPAIQKNGYWSGESTLRHLKNQDTVPVMINSFLIYNDLKKAIGVGTIQRDITDKKRSETALKSSEKKYKELINLAQEGIWVIDENSFTSFVNPSMAKMLGYSIDEMKGRHLFDFMDDQGVEIAKCNIERREKGIIEQHDFEFRNKNGNKVIVVLETAPIIDEQGNFKGAIAGAVDITARKKMEELLRENERELERKVFDRTSELGQANEELSQVAKELKKAYDNVQERTEELLDTQNNFKFALQSAQVGTWFLDMVKNHNQWDDRALEIYGVTKDNFDPTYEGWRKLVHPEDIEQAEHNFNKSIDQDILFSDTHRTIKPNGEIAYVLAQGIVKKDTNGKPIRTNGVVFDITEKVLREQELQNAKEQTEEANCVLHKQKEELTTALHQLKESQSQLIQSEKMASLGVLTAGIAHEINNPVNFVYAGINSLKDNLTDVKKILAVYEGIDLNNMASKLTEVHKVKLELQYDKLMNFVDRSTANITKGAERASEIVKGLSTFSRIDSDKATSTDIHESLNNTLLLLRNQYKDNVVIHKKYGKIPLVECYPGKLNQVFVNVIANAIQSIKKQGTIIISTQELQKNQHGFIEIAITDNGEGMDEKIRSRIFEPFFTTKDVGQGTGLGLSISHGIIDSHNGFVEVESQVNKGTTFKIFLPMDKAS